ncbi:sensor histidine kinase [Sphingomonas sp. PAMC26645]|uniref:sensor histidine kinase n=1 Tax=Sphingomonas sp. PAMC26645 TaxID=2565555 RepID=UPI00109DEF1E|nr:ATP-binding protein [Sphingomonas sp. PAMC26645]QCB43280.1 sensor histidine kinase [Sphingomonas sp. PAMC26645]
MAFRRRFAVRLAARVLLLLFALSVASLLAAYGRAPAAMLLAVGFAILATFGLWSLVSESNAELARFVAALDRVDLSQSFTWNGRGSGFDRLGAAYERALARLREERAGGATAATFASALADGAPTPLLVLGPGDALTLGNKAARRQFGRGSPTDIAALGRYGEAFVELLRGAVPGPSRLGRIVVDGLSQRVVVDATLIELAGDVRRIVAVKVIQAELDGAELAAQIDLVRVLTHEIMNSLTPVTSLAATARHRLDALDPTDNPAIGDAQLAVGALARRAGELEHFVETYKGFSEAPALRRERIDVSDWLTRTATVHAAMPNATAPVTLNIAPDLRPLYGDAALLTQVLLNLLKNASEAVASTERPAIALTAETRPNGRIRIAVTDNGPGIATHLSREVFLPFFTTKPRGSGIGLSFARQIVLLHGGQIEVGDGLPSRIEMILPTTLC